MHSLTSHTHQLARLTFITETTWTSKRRPKGGLTKGDISISGVLVLLTACNYLRDDPFGTAVLLLVMALGDTDLNVL